MKRTLSLCGALLAAGSLFAQDIPATVQGQPHPYGQAAGTTTQQAETLQALPAPGGDNFSMDDIEFWVGEGSNRAAFAVQWNDPRETNALVWGYCFDGDKYGIDLVRDIAAADPRFYAMIQSTSLGYTICGLGYDLDGDGEIALKNSATGETIYPDEDGIFINSNGYDYDNYSALDEDDYWGAGWYESYWSYWVSDGGSGFSYSNLGASSRQLSDGSWDGWNFAAGMTTTGFKDFAAAPAPGYTNGSFFLRSDGSSSRIDFLDDNGGWELDIYSAANTGEKLPATLQKPYVFSGKVLLLSPESGKVIVADAGTLVKEGEIPIASPRCFAGTTPSQSYIGTDNGVYPVDLDNFSVGARIEAAGTAAIQTLICTQNRLFALDGGGSVLSIDPASGQAEALPVGNCTGLVQTASGALWAACGSTLVRIDPATLETTSTSLPEYAPAGKGLAGSSEEEVLYFASGSSTDSCSIFRFEPDNAASIESPFFSLDENRHDFPYFTSPAPTLDAKGNLLYIYARTASGGELAYTVEATSGAVLSEEENDGTVYTAAAFFPDASPSFSGLESSLTFQINDPARTISLAGTYSDPDDVDANIQLTASSSNEEILQTSLDGDGNLSITPVEGQSGSAEVLLSLLSRGTTVEKKIAVTINCPLEGIEIPDTIYMKTGQKDTLEVRFIPETATNQSVTWKYESYSMANITSAGIITARKAGETYVTATAADGGFTDTCRVFISDQPVTGLRFLQDTIDVYVNRYDTLEYEVLPSDASTQTMSWEVEDASIISFATYSQRITGLQEGTTRIFGTTTDGGFRDTCVVRVTFLPATAISLEEEEVWLTAPNSQVLDILPEPANASNQDFSAYAVNPAVAEATTYINSTGLTVRIKGLTEGETQIVVQSDDDPGLIAICTAHISYVPLLGFSLNRNDTILAVGRSFTLSKQFEPENGASNDTVAFTSSNETVASVSSSGYVRALSAGETSIVATTREGGYTDTCHVTVVESIPLEGISFPQAEYILDEGGSSRSIAVTRTPSNATNTSVSYWTEDESVVYVSSAGYLTIRGAGQTIVVATSAEGGYTDTCHITVRPAAESLQLSADTLHMVPQDSAWVTASVLPAGANQEYTWSSSDASVATIDSAGKVRALKAGEAYLVAEAGNGVSGTCAVVVENQLSRSVRLDAREVVLEEGDALQLSALVLPENTTDPSVRWTSSDHGVASVSAQGYVKAYAEGQAVIRAISKDGSGSSDSCVVDVTRRTGTSIGQTVEQAAACNAYMQGSILVVEGCAGATLRLSSYSGQLIRVLQPADERVYYPAALAPGVYLLSGEGQNGKIALKILVE